MFTALINVSFRVIALNQPDSDPDCGPKIGENNQGIRRFWRRSGLEVMHILQSAVS